MSDSVNELLKKRLDELSIDYKILQHEAVTTSADAARVRGVDLSTGAKALVVKAGEQYTMFVFSASRQLDWKAVKQIVGSKSARLASEEELLETTGLTKGSVPPFGNLLGLHVFVDSSILEQDVVRFNAGSLTESIQMPGQKVLDAVDGEWADFSKEP